MNRKVLFWPLAAMLLTAVMMFKDSYMLDYINVEEIGVRDKIDVDECVVEKEIVNKVKNFIRTYKTGKKLSHVKYSSKRSDFLRFYDYLCHVIDDFACL